GWSWLSRGSAIGTEYTVHADTATLASALGLSDSSSSAEVLAALDAQAARDPERWFDDHDVKTSQWDTWRWYALDGTFHGSDG
ncbi:MAG: hypothetical protein WC580_09040, partial [Agrococcus sp.]